MNTEIGKLEDGQKDPCFDCKNLPGNDGACKNCKDYDKYQAPS